MRAIPPIDQVLVKSYAA